MPRELFEAIHDSDNPGTFDIWEKGKVDESGNDANEFVCSVSGISMTARVIKALHNLEADEIKKGLDL